MIRQFCAAVLVGAACQAADAQSMEYVPYSGIVTGTEGAVAVPLTIRNGTLARLACRAELAHWYSVDLGEAGPGGALAVTLWHDPLTGRLDLLNKARNRMPVEALWCGVPPGVHATRGRVGLPIVTGPLPAGLQRTCTEGTAGRVVCAGN